MPLENDQRAPRGQAGQCDFAAAWCVKVEVGCLFAYRRRECYGHGCYVSLPVLYRLFFLMIRLGTCGGLLYSPIRATCPARTPGR
jgi:hypothetical protein